MLSPSDFNNAVPQFTNGDYASNPINPQYIAEPDAVDYNRGAEPLQTLPAQWWNWFLNKFTNRFNKVNIYVKNIFNELTQLLSLVSVTPSGTEGSPTVGQLKDMFENKYPNYLALLMYPIGSIYWTGKAPNNGGDPNTLFGGTWVQIKDKFILAAGDTYTNGATGGSATVTLTVDQIPSHDHSFTPSGSVSVTTNPTFSGTSVTTGGSSATNTGSESSHTHGLSGTFTTGNCIAKDSATAITATGGMSANSTGTFVAVTAWDEANNWVVGSTTGTSATFISGNVSRTSARHSGQTGTQWHEGTNADSKYTINVAHTHNMEHRHEVTLSGSTGAGSSHSHTMAHTHSVTASGTISGGAYKFTGTAGTTGAKGGGQAHDNMPPYIVKYCWERTA